MTAYQPTVHNGLRYCANCGCVEAMHDERTLQCPRDDDPRWSVVVEDPPYVARLKREMRDAYLKERK